MEDFFEDDEVVSVEETDDEYEFDASQFYDFTRSELDHEVEEAERWFEVSGDYPPSPFIVKLNLGKILSVEIFPSSSSKAKQSTDKSISGSSDADSRHGVSGGKKDSKGKSPTTTAKSKTGSPSFMEPTASHRAKQKTSHANSTHVCTRFEKISARLSQKGSQSPTGSDIATKRQKLSVGYLRKFSQLKHQFLLMHKSTKKVTVPKEPELETMLRAQRRRSKNSSVCSETESQKQKPGSFKAHPLNKKILEPRLSPQLKKSPPQLPEFQEFNLKTMERANHHVSAKVHPGATDFNVTRDPKQKPTSSRVERKSSTGRKFSESPPTEQFSKLSLGSTSQSSRRSSAKDQKTSASDPSQGDFWRCSSKPKHCGDHIRFRIDAKCWPDMSRSLDIR